MAADAPKYNVGDVVYLRESAGVGHIESVRINGIYSFQGSWAYTIASSSMNNQSSNTYGDRISMVNRSTIYFSQSELITKVEALEIAITMARAKLTALETQYTAITS